MKRKKMNRAMAFLLSCILVMCMCPITVFAGTSITIMGTDIMTMPDYTMEVEGGVVTYNPDTQTLTLDNATLDTTGTNNGCIRADDELTIKLVGDNKLIEGSGYSSIYSPGDLTFTGDGSLEITGGGASINSSAGDIEFDNVDVICQGIQATGGSVSISNGADLTVNSGMTSIYANVDIEIVGSIVNAASSNGKALLCVSGKVKISDGSAVKANGYDKGIDSYNGISISGSIVNSQSESGSGFDCRYGDTEITDNSDVTINSSSYGIYADKITISESKVDVTSHFNQAIFSYKGVTISGSEVTANGGVRSTNNNIIVAPVSGGLVEVKAGVTAEDAVHIDNSPFAEETVLGKQYDGYFSCKTHIHAGGSATCLDKAVCDDCGREYGDYGEHTPTRLDAQAATCTEDGKTEGSKCAICNEILVKQEAVPATGHSYRWIIDREATAADDGSMHEECTVCAHKKDAVKIPATGTEQSTEEPDNTATTEPDNTATTEPDNTATTEPDNAATTEAVKPDNPSTGDEGDIFLMLALMLVSGAGIIGVTAHNRSKKEQ